MAWTILILTPLVILGRSVKSPSKPETTYSKNAGIGLTGDTNLCIVIGGVIGNYSAGGDPGDVYEWKITKSTGEELLSRRGGDQYESIQFLYNEVGDYTVSLKIRRGTDSNFYEESLDVKIQKGPELELKPDYLVCGDAPVLLTALNPTTPNLSDYTIIWKSLDIDGNQVDLGTGNEYLAYDNGYHFVELFLTNADGTQACTVNGSTFVGPPVDFQITQSDEKICEDENILIGTDTPLTGEWFIRKSGAATKTSLGSAFEITLGSSDLTGPGVYEVFFSAVDERYPDCPSERKIAFELLESPTVDTQILVAPDDCITENGSFQITANSNLDSMVIPELGVSESPVLAGQVLTYSNLKPMIYSIITTQNGCEITKLVQLGAKKPPVTPSPPNQLTSTITNFPETCSADGVINGKIEVDFGQTIGNGTYRLFSVSRGQIDAGAIPTSGLLELDLSSDSYILEKVIDGCTYPNESFTIADQPQVEFSIPKDFQICENFDFIPETAEDLLFTLTFPDGSTQDLESGQPFALAEAGSYSLKAESNDPSSTLCPRVEEFNVTVSTKITFEPILVEKGCFDPIQYIADIEGLLPEETSIRWLNSEDVIVGRGLEFYPGTIGIFSLIVQPLGSAFCDVAPIEFEVVPPVTSVPMELETTKICPEPGFAVVTLTTDEEEVSETEWIFYDLNDQRRELPEFHDLLEIVVDEPGTYEAVGYNKFHCEIGRNFILVEESSLLALPNLDESYPICLKNNTLSPIDPGDYEKYEWFFEEQLVSTERLYNPVQVGDYRLLVTTVDGCEFEDNFRTYDVCDYQIVYPNAMILGDPEKNFRVLVSEGITEAELFILNRQGELIYHTSTNDIPLEVPILTWDGKASGEYVPTGNYVVVIILRNALYGLEEKETVPLLVID
ncbi:hypothetical protein SYJ56_03985 [Algoriphagus sp. D3-2-R+10]|uniref:hypothetical protein n=1 Tax=Algoriphagus aurantiacus TaxID=3103948 RepID=UPI002B3D24E1|nr:hypothetical protein [Algoriphagus sp. D3-2-R+10]MEB2774450.1 hypothetical protein [Algoriphagus sp. D3-2-R+10]